MQLGFFPSNSNLLCIKKESFNIYINATANSVIDKAITLTNDEIITKENVIVVPYGSSSGGVQCVVLQAYKSASNVLNVKLWNPSANAIASSVRQGYMAYFF